MSGLAGLAYALLAEEARHARPGSALGGLSAQVCTDAAHASLSVYLHSVENPDADVVADIVERFGAPIMRDS